MTNYTYILFWVLSILILLEWLIIWRLFYLRMNWKVHLLFICSHFLIFTVIFNEFISYMTLAFRFDTFFSAENIFWYLIILLLIWIKVYVFWKLTNINSIKIILFSIGFSLFLTISFNGLLWYFIYSIPCFLCV